MGCGARHGRVTRTPSPKAVWGSHPPAPRYRDTVFSKRWGTRLSPLHENTGSSVQFAFAPRRRYRTELDVAEGEPVHRLGIGQVVVVDASIPIEDRGEVRTRLPDDGSDTTVVLADDDIVQVVVVTPGSGAPQGKEIHRDSPG